jgi:Sulfotransferase family
VALDSTSGTIRMGAPSVGDLDERLFLAPDDDRVGFPWRHVLTRTVVLPEQKILVLGVPKTGWTSMLWGLAELAGVDLDRFGDSTSTEVSPAMAVHDMHQWPERFRFGSYSAGDRREILADDDWFRFALVRDPAPRLWSAWQSKLLLREPRYVELFAAAPWFPGLPETPEGLVDDFRRFVAALGDPAMEDVHWGRQSDLTRLLPLHHVGRIEDLSDTLQALQAHTGVDVPAPTRRENTSPLRLPAHAFDEAALDKLRTWYAGDYDQFGYSVPEAASEDDPVWREQAAAVIPLLGTVIERHRRIGDLSRLARRATVGTPSGSRGSALAGATAGKSAVLNAEGNPDYAIDWRWASEQLAPGFTAVVRVKNEARTLPWTLPPLLRATERVLLVDNGSTDETVAVAEQVAQSMGAGDRFEVREYPFRVSRCGPEHLGTRPDSIHSLTYFYNWAFSLVGTSYALKWDGDMMLTDSGVQALRDLAWQLETRQCMVSMPRYPLYVADSRTAYLDVAISNREFWGWPNARGFEHAKAFEWEVMTYPRETETIALPDWACVELKHLDGDEFSHWSSQDFGATRRTLRKKREVAVFEALAAAAPPPEGVVRVDAPDGVDVVDYVRAVWLSANKADLRRLHRRASARLT